MPTTQIEDAPLDEQLVQFSAETAKRIRLDEEKGDGRISPRWYDWIWQALLTRISSTPQQYDAVVSEEGLSASQPTTAISLPTIGAGRYRVTVHVKVRQAAGATSEILATIGYTNNGVACVQATTNLTSNTTASVRSAVFGIVVDNDSPITWATTYLSTGVPSMTYDVDISIEAQN